MGEHKIPGASKGPGYKDGEKVVSSSMVWHQSGAHKPGTIVATKDNRKYEVARDGSWRRA